MAVRLCCVLWILLLGSWTLAQEQSSNKIPGYRKGNSASSDPGPRTQTPPAISISGTVVLGDGKDLPGPVQVQLRCRGSVRQEDHTSKDGRFSFTLGTSASADRSMDVTIGGPASLSTTPDLLGRKATDPYQRGGLGKTTPFGRVNLGGCHVEAFLPGYQSEKVNLGFRSPFDKPDIGAVMLHRINPGDADTVSVNSLKASQEAMESYRKAREELAKEPPGVAQAVALLRESTLLYPAFASAWQLLGEALLMEGNESEAAEAFERSIAGDPGLTSPYFSLAELRIRAGRWKEAADLAEQGLGLDDSYLPGYYFVAIACYYLGNLDRALAAIKVIQDSGESARFPQCHYLGGMILAEQGEYEEALQELRQFLDTGPPAPVVAEIESFLARWQDQGLITPAQASNALSSGGSP